MANRLRQPLHPTHTVGLGVLLTHQTLLQALVPRPLLRPMGISSSTMANTGNTRRSTQITSRSRNCLLACLPNQVQSQQLPTTEQLYLVFQSLKQLRQSSLSRLNLLQLLVQRYSVWNLPLLRLQRPQPSHQLFSA